MSQRITEAAADEFELEFSVDNGSVPPPYRRETTIQIDRDGQGRYTRLHGYDRQQPGQHFEAEFVLDSATRREFVAQVRRLGVFDRPWREQSRPPVGGSSVSLSLRVAEQSLRLPAHPLPEQRVWVDPLRTLVQALVPADVLAARAAWEAARGDE